MLRLHGVGGDVLAARMLSDPAAEATLADVPAAVRRELRGGGFVVPPSLNELEAIHRLYRRARTETPMIVTITTTMDCNLGCYYCYETRTSDALAPSDVDTIAGHVEDRLGLSPDRSLHVDWYGGEPMLNVAFLERASARLQRLCEERGVSYSASVISNGTGWPAEVGEFVRRHRIHQGQMSFDGLKAHHDRRRHYRPGRSPHPDASAFEEAVGVVDRLLDHVRVDVRINLDRGNRDDLAPFLAFVAARGWFDRPHPAVIQPARLSAYTERSSFMRPTELTLPEFDALRAEVRRLAHGRASVEESEVPDGFPYPRSSVCAALADASFVVGADRNLYRCGLQVGETQRAVGRLPGDAKFHLPLLSAERDDAGWWAAFDPTTRPRCARCSFLPVCWSGCPKKHLEGDQHAIEEQGRFWRENLGRLVAEGHQEDLRDGFVVPDSQQFR